MHSILSLCNGLLICSYHNYFLCSITSGVQSNVEIGHIIVFNETVEQLYVNDVQLTMVWADHTKLINN